MASQFLGLSLWVWGGLACLGVSALFGFVVPRPKRAAAEGWRSLVLRWGHAFVWALLAAMCGMWAFGQPALGNAFGLAAGVTYVIFLLTLLTSRS